MTPWLLPETAEIGGKIYHLNTDFRDMLEIMRYLEDPNQPEYLRWKIAVALFFEEELPEDHLIEAEEYLADFIAAGDKDMKPGPKLLDWEQDAQAIVADINKVAGTEIRSIPYMHWWTFLSYFQAIGEGQLSTLVSIRDKLRRGKKLERWEQEYYRKNSDRVNLRTRYSAEELAEQERLKKLLGD